MDLEAFFSEEPVVNKANSSASSKYIRRQIFTRDEEGKVHLVDKRGKLVPDVEWDNPPTILSGAFMIGRVNSKLAVYTIVGEAVRGAEVDSIELILNFWMIYEKRGSKYIARL